MGIEGFCVDDGAFFRTILELKAPVGDGFTLTAQTKADHVSLETVREFLCTPMGAVWRCCRTPDGLKLVGYCADDHPGVKNPATHTVLTMDAVDDFAVIEVLEMLAKKSPFYKQFLASLIGNLYPLVLIWKRSTPRTYPEDYAAAVDGWVYSRILPILYKGSRYCFSKSAQ